MAPQEHWIELIEKHGRLCFYCQMVEADTIDHVLPKTRAGSDNVENLRPSCRGCNIAASSRRFNDAEEKRAYLQSKIRDGYVISRREGAPPDLVRLVALKDAVLKAKEGKTLRALASALGLPESSIGILRKASLGMPLRFENEEKLFVALGVTPPHHPVIALPCPDCGKAHTGRCNGKPVVEVVALAPGEVVKPAPKARQRKAYWRPCLSPELGTALAEAGIDVEAALWSAVERSHHGRQN